MYKHEVLHFGFVFMSLFSVLKILVVTLSPLLFVCLFVCFFQGRVGPPGEPGKNVRKIYM